MSKIVRIRTIDDVANDEQLKDMLKTFRQTVTLLCREFAHAAADLSAMLRVYDQKAGRKRRGKVVRPLALAAAVLVLVSRYVTLCAKRFEVEYAEEIAAHRRRARQPRRFRFGP